MFDITTNHGVAMTTTMPVTLAAALAALASIPAGTCLPIKLLLDGRTSKALAKRGIPLRECANNGYGKGPKECYCWAPEVPADQRLTPQRVTRNMLNPTGGEFLIDEDTPSYCDPGCESYHSM